MDAFNLDNNDVTSYTRLSSPSLPDDYIFHSFLDTATDKLYVSSSGGLATINLDGTYNAQGVRYSSPLSLSTSQSTGLTWSESIGSGQTISFQTRTGDADSVWFDDFDTDDSSVGDVYGWGAAFQTSSVSNSVLRLSNPDSSWGAYSWFDTGKAADYFPIGTTVQAKVRMNSVDSAREYIDFMFLDEWDGADVKYDIVNDWVYLTLIADHTFSRIGFEPYFIDYGGWDASDSFEIDWIKITTPDSMGFWNDWSSPCTESRGCEVTSETSGQSWIQYRANLATTDTSTTPSVSSVSLVSYPTTGSFTSEVIDMDQGKAYGVFNTRSYIPANTSIEFQMRSGNTSEVDSQWSSWQTISGTDLPGYQRYLQIKTSFNSSSQGVTPILYSMSINTDETEPEASWTDAENQLRHFNALNDDNEYTTDSLPEFKFSKGFDSKTSIQKYQIILTSDSQSDKNYHDHVYIDNIDANRPGDTGIREDDTKTTIYQGCVADNCATGSGSDYQAISVRSKRDQDKLPPGAYKWKARVIDRSGNSKDTQEKILRVNTPGSTFSSKFFPISLLRLGNLTHLNLSSLYTLGIASKYTISTTTPKLYGIAASDSQVTAVFKKDGEIILTKQTTASDSRFEIQVEKADKLGFGTYQLELSANHEDEYIQLPSFDLNIFLF